MQLVRAGAAALEPVIGTAIHDQDVFNRLDMVFQMLAGADRVQHAIGGVSQRRGAPVMLRRHVLRQRHRINDSHCQPGFMQGQRQGQTGEPAAGNHHIARKDRFAHGR